MPPAMLQLADDAETIAKRLIPQYHQHLAEAKILYVFTDKKRKKCDRVKLGSAQKLGDLHRFLASQFESVESGPDYLILLDVNSWGFMEPIDQEKLIFHELCHCKLFVKSGNKWVRLPEDEDRDDYNEWKFGLVAHDIEEFGAVVKKYGLPQTESDKEWTQAVRQHALPGMNQRHLEAVV